MMNETCLHHTGRFILSIFIFKYLIVLQKVFDRSRLVSSFRLNSWRTKRRRRLRVEDEHEKKLSYSLSLIRLSLVTIILLLCKSSSVQASMFGVADDSLDRPQPLIYLPAHEIGSGMGPTSSSSSWSVGQHQQASSSSPALITAKCWNNYQTDEDCRHIQVITADQQENSPLPPTSADNINNMITNDDDSLISPVILFESSSTLEPSNSAVDGSSGNSQSQPAFLAPPYFSAPSSDRSPQFVEQTNRQIDEQQQQQPKHRVFFNRHHQQPSTPPTANDLFGSAPPAGATLLPPTYTATRTSFEQQTRKPPSSIGSGFVATPRPKKPPKSTTAGRRCRDENDADCDEPDENDSAGDANGTNDNDDNNNSNNVNDDDTTDANEQTDNSGNNKPGLLSSPGSLNEFGSGNEPDDDNENDDDDDDSELESSGAFYESSPSSSNIDDAGQIIQITSTSKYPSGTPTPYANSNEGVSSVSAGAEIEVVVHPTLPPLFPSSSSQSSWPARSRDAETQVSSSGTYGPSSPTSTSTTTSTTAMPDDTFKSKPVFPSSVSADDGNAISFSFITDEQKMNKKQQENSTIIPTTDNLENIDLATFKPVPMPAVDPELQQARRPSDNFHNFRSPSSPSGGLSSQHSSTGNERDEQNKLADRHRLDFNMPLPEVTQPTTPSQQPVARPFESPWREKPLRGQQFGLDQPSWRLNKLDDSVERRLLLAQQVTASQQQQQQQQPEMLPTLLLYASIIILVVTASIFIIMAFVFWRRNSIRQKALLSSKTALLNGGAGASFGVGGATGMMANQPQQQSHLITGLQTGQQPGLLSTYAPGKGFSSKLTGNLMKENPQEIVNEDQEEEDDDDDEEEEEEEEEVGEEEDDEEISFNNNQNLKDLKNQQAPHPIPTNQPQQPTLQRALHRPSQQSWSTDENPTSSSAGSSQRTIDSQQAVVPILGVQQLGGRGSAVQHNGRQHYSNSLSNGHQNSSSLSDWQSSPVDPIQVPYPSRPIPPMSTSHYPPDNGQLYRNTNQYPSPMISHQPQPMPIYPDQYYSQQPVPLHRQPHIQNGFAPPVIPNAINKNFNSYHSVENLDNPHQMNYEQPPFPNLNGPPIRMSRRI